MKYKMKILDQYIEPIKKHIKTTKYCLYTENRQKIKTGDTLLLFSDKKQYVKVKINSMKLFSTLEEAIEANREEKNSRFSQSESKVSKYFYKYYTADDIKKYGIIVYNIEPLVYIYKEARVLIDTNTIIYRESQREVNFEVSELYKWFDKLKMTKLVHPLTEKELKKYENETQKRTMISKLNSYEKIIPNEIQDDFFKSIVNQYSQDENSIIDNNILLQVYCGLADYLVTNDKILIKKANKLFLGNQVFSVSDFLKNIEDRYPELIDYKMLSVKLRKFGDIKHETDFFDTLREDYPDFNKWFLKKNNKSAYVFEKSKVIKGFLYLKVEDKPEEYNDIIPKMLPLKRLKVGTFKIDNKGFRLGERFLKIIFDNALKNNVDEIYVTMFENKRIEIDALKNIMMKWGFVKYGVKVNTGEKVFVKDMRNYDNQKSPKFNYPLLKANLKYSFLPIYYQYHTDLFPDFILKNENMNLYQDNLAHRYSIEKIYISKSYNNPKPGDIVLIYRLGERRPKRYSSVLTGLAIIEDVIEPNNLEEYLKICSNKSVFTKQELNIFYCNKGYKKVIKLLNYQAFDKKVTLNDLYELNIVKENCGPRPFDSISKLNYDKIIRKSKGIK